ncbi:MAG TPA: ATP cone domain-containing protein [Phycisphaerae bacterium]|nr:ATP cone domain-containing protein [Phycisphaerae bacterium]
MSGSGKIRVIKRDGTEERFEAAKLAGAIFTALRETSGEYGDACRLALAIEVYLDRSGWGSISSGAIFDMAVKVLRRSGLAAAGGLLQRWHSRRHRRRQGLCIRHDDDTVTLWDKTWLSQWAERSWFLSRGTARILAGEIEQELLAREVVLVSRRDVLNLLNERVAQYGLADAVPVRLAARQ